MTDKIELKGITWDHPRGYDPLIAVSKEYAKVNLNIRVKWDVRTLKEFGDMPIENLIGKYDLITRLKKELRPSKQKLYLGATSMQLIRLGANQQARTTESEYLSKIKSGSTRKLRRSPAGVSAPVLLVEMEKQSCAPSYC